MTKPIDLGTNRLSSEEVSEEQDTNLAPSSELSSQQKQTPSADVNLTEEEKAMVENRIIDALRTCFDPEIPVNIYELGLIYKIDVQTNGRVNVDMTLTSPACPVAGSLPGDVQRKVMGVDKVTGAEVKLVWDPPWDKTLMSEAAKLQLGIDD